MARASSELILKINSHPQLGGSSAPELSNLPGFPPASETPFSARCLAKLDWWVLGDLFVTLMNKLLTCMHKQVPRGLLV